MSVIGDTSSTLSPLKVKGMMDLILEFGRGKIPKFLTQDDPINM